MADPIQEGLDLVLQIFPPHSNSLLEKHLFPVRKVFCAAPNHLEEEPVIETPHDLFKHDFACYFYYPWGDKWPKAASASKSRFHRCSKQTACICCLISRVLGGQWFISRPWWRRRICLNTG